MARRRIEGDGAPAANPLADIRITDALEEANRVLIEADPDGRAMTTGAAYNIWPAQADFQADLMVKVLDEAAVPGIERVRATTLQGLADQLPWRSVLGATIEVDFRESFAVPSVFLMIGLAAFAPPADVAVVEQGANERYLAETGELLGAIIRYSGRRLRTGRTVDDLIWALEALEIGYLLRMRTHPDIPLATDETGSSALATAAIGIVEAFTETANATDEPTTGSAGRAPVDVVEALSYAHGGCLAPDGSQLRMDAVAHRGRRGAVRARRPRSRLGSGSSDRPGSRAGMWPRAAGTLRSCARTAHARPQLFRGMSRPGRPRRSPSLARASAARRRGAPTAS